MEWCGLQKDNNLCYISGYDCVVSLNTNSLQVRIFKFKPEPFPTENSFSLLQGIKLNPIFSKLTLS